MRPLYYLLVLSLAASIDCQTNWTLANLIPNGYNVQNRPSANNGPTLVVMSIKVISFVAVTETDQSMTLDMVYSQRWQDTRLVLPPSSSNLFPLSLDSSWKAKFWVPDIYFMNAQSATTLSVFGPVTELQVDNSSTITFINRMTVKFSCPMDLFRYPQDDQTCFIDALSLTQRSSYVQMVWGTFELVPLSFTKYYIYSYSNGSCSAEAGDHSCIRASIRLFRKLGHYVIRYYAPSFLLTTTTLVGFWIPVLGWPARVQVVVLPMLAIIVMQVVLYADIGSSYIVALHIWMAWCEFFAFMSLMEYAVAIQWAHRVEARKAAKAAIEAKQMNTSINNNLVTFSSSRWSNCWSKTIRLTDKFLLWWFGPINYEKAPTNQNKIDYIARLIYPLLWSIFVWIYLCVFVWPWLAANTY